MGSKLTDCISGLTNHPCSNSYENLFISHPNFHKKLSVKNRVTIISKHSFDQPIHMKMVKLRVNLTSIRLRYFFNISIAPPPKTA